jgi:hypothetical protein
MAITLTVDNAAQTATGTSDKRVSILTGGAAGEETQAKFALPYILEDSTGHVWTKVSDNVLNTDEGKVATAVYKY